MRHRKLLILASLMILFMVMVSIQCTDREKLKEEKYHFAIRSKNIQELESYIILYGKDNDDNANEIKRTLKEARFEQATASKSIEEMEKYLQNYPEHDERTAEIRTILKTERRAWHFNKIREIEDFLRINRDGDEKKILEAKKKLKYHKYEIAQDVNTMKLFLSEYEKDKDDQVKDVRLRLEEMLIKDMNDYWGSCESYLKFFPDGKYVQAARENLDRLRFEAIAKKGESSKAYEYFIGRYPESDYVEKARERLAYLKSQKAVVRVSYPKTVDWKDSHWNYEWETVFEETGGKLSLKLEGAGCIRDPRGRVWTTVGQKEIKRKKIKVPAGGSTKTNYACADESHEFCNGYAIFTWAGQDSGGHPIKIIEKVHLRHKGCPGKGKRN